MRLDASRKHLSANWWYQIIRSRLSEAVSSVGFKPHVTELAVNGRSFQFFVASPLGKSWYEHPNLHSQEMAALSRLINVTGSTVLECGGHHGRDTMVLAMMTGPLGRVVTFEPHPDNATIIQRNVELNRLNNVTVCQSAVGAAEGSAVIRTNSNAKIIKGAGGIGIHVTTIDAWSRASGIHPDIIKIDVEGYEIEVLRGARNVLERHPAILLELHCDIIGEFGGVPSDIWNLIDSSCYSIYIQCDDGSPEERFVTGSDLRGRPHLFFVPN